MNRPDFSGLSPTSGHASAVGRGNRRSNTRPEIVLRRALWKRGFRYRLHSSDLSGRPDLVFWRQRLAVFCDGDFWHGKDWPSRRAKLARGSNPEYWIAKISANMERDRRVTAQLRRAGWQVLRVWESDIKNDLDAVLSLITAVVEEAKEI